MLRTLVVSIAATLLAVPVAAHADGPHLADFDLALTSRAPGTRTGLVLRVLFRDANDPAAKPPPVRGVVLRLPDGLRFDTRAMTQCTASDAELRLLGASACPAASEVALGSFSAITGFGAPVDPVVGDDHVFNGPDQLVEVVTVPSTTLSPGFDRLTISGATLTAHPPTVPGGPPDGETATRSIAFRIVPRASGPAYITTPPTCPASGAWTSTGTFTFAGGVTTVVRSTTPCTPARSPARPRLRVTVRPRAVRAGRRSRLAVALASSSPACVRGATVRAGRAAAVTGARGRAVLTVAPRRAGTLVVRATRSGCAAGLTRVRVLPRPAGRRTLPPPRRPARFTG